MIRQDREIYIPSRTFADIKSVIEVLCPVECPVFHPTSNRKVKQEINRNKNS